MKTSRLFSTVPMLMMCLATTSYRVPAQQSASGLTGSNRSKEAAGTIDLSTLLAQTKKTRRRGFSLMPDSGDVNASAPAFSITPMTVGNLPVIGSGAMGRLAKWMGFTSSNAAIGDSSIYEDKFGKVGIGTDSPTSTLTVAGTIEATGGFKFPASAHEATLKGDGTTASPLGVSVPLVLSGAVPLDAVISSTSTAAGGVGLRGLSTNGNGVEGSSTNNAGVSGTSPSSVGVAGASTNGVGVFGGSSNGSGVRGNSLSTSDTQAAIVGIGSPGGALAGIFIGKVDVAGTLSKTAGTFKIDHPLDPENRYLYHSFVESPDMMNIYNGNITTDENGDAVVELPEYFDALNRDFRYQLTVIGTFAQAIVAEEIKGNRFTVRTTAPNVKVSWLVTGVRNDAYARKNRVKVEEDKPEQERGYFLHPEVFDQPEERSVQWARDPEAMRQLKQRRSEVEQARMRQPKQR